MRITSILVEGGSRVTFFLMDGGLVERVDAVVAPKLVGGSQAVTPVEGEGFAQLAQAVELENIQTSLLDNDVMITGRVRRPECE